VHAFAPDCEGDIDAVVDEEWDPVRFTFLVKGFCG
jgi:hypothetical protein